MQSLNEMKQVEKEVQSQNENAKSAQACVAEYGSRN